MPRRLRLRSRLLWKVVLCHTTTKTLRILAVPGVSNFLATRDACSYVHCSRFDRRRRRLRHKVWARASARTDWRVETHHKVERGMHWQRCTICVFIRINYFNTVELFRTNSLCTVERWACRELLFWTSLEFATFLPHRRSLKSCEQLLLQIHSWRALWLWGINCCHGGHDGILWMTIGNGGFSVRCPLLGCRREIATALITMMLLPLHVLFPSKVCIEWGSAFSSLCHTELWEVEVCRGGVVLRTLRDFEDSDNVYTKLLVALVLVNSKSMKTKKESN